jgi:hypothetical protein
MRQAILNHLGLPTTAPPLAPARGPPPHDLVFDANPALDFDQTPAYDPSESEPAPDVGIPSFHSHPPRGTLRQPSPARSTELFFDPGAENAV